MESLELLNMCRSYEEDMLKLRQHLELLSDMAAAASMGLKVMPNAGYSAPAATGMPSAL